MNKLLILPFLSLALSLPAQAEKTTQKKLTPTAKSKKETIKKGDATKKSKGATVVIMKTNHGEIEIELYPDKAKESVKNFLDYVDKGFYDDTIFHRVISNFMIQGGGFDANLEKKTTGKPIQNEADNGLTNQRGTLAMARTSDPHSATAQFFINVKDNDFLNHTGKNQKGWGYAVFGKVAKGMDVVDKIKVVPTDKQKGYENVPVNKVLIEKMTRKSPDNSKK